MPLRDHFQVPVSRVASWEEVHGMWPAVLVQHLFRILPAGFVAAPRVHRGTQIEIDVATYELDPQRQEAVTSISRSGHGGVATAAEAPPKPTLELETELPEQDEYEVRVYDERYGRELVAAIELVSPANKDRPENRRAFVAKCAALLQKKVCVSIVDLITTRHFNLYEDLLDLIGRPESVPRPADASAIYAVTCQGRRPLHRRPRIATWVSPLAVGQPLPPLLIWLAEDLNVTLDLEASYEETCRFLHIA